MLPVIRSFMAAHRLSDVTIVADAGMVSEANRKAIEAEGLDSSASARRAACFSYRHAAAVPHPDTARPINELNQLAALTIMRRSRKLRNFRFQKLSTYPVATIAHEGAC